MLGNCLVVLIPCNLFPFEVYGEFLNMHNMQIGNKVLWIQLPLEDINSGLNMDNMQQVNSEQRDIPIEDFNGRQELSGSSETSQEN